MPDNGAGTYSLPRPAFTSGTPISSAAVNDDLADIAAALNNRLARNGENTPAANLPMAGYRHTGVGNAVARTDYASAGQIQDGGLVWCGDAGGTGNAPTINPSPGITAYAAGQRFAFKPPATNNGPVTLAVSGLSAVPVVDALIGSPLMSGAMRAGGVVEVMHDGTAFRLAPVNPQMRDLGSVTITSTVATVSFSIPTNATRLMLNFQQLVPTAAAQLFAQVSTDGGSSYKAGVSDYNFAYEIVGGGAVTQANTAQAYLSLSVITPLSGAGVLGSLEWDGAAQMFLTDSVALQSPSGAYQRFRTAGRFDVTGPLTNIRVGFVGASIGIGRVRLLGEV